MVYFRGRKAGYIHVGMATHSHSVHTRTHLNDRGSRGQFEKSSITVLGFVFKLFSVILIKMKAFVIKLYIKLPFSYL